MDKLFGFGKKDLSEEVKTQNRSLRASERGLERDRNQLERELKRLELEIKKMAKQGNKQACTVLAKQLINLRKQHTRSYQAQSKISSIKTQNQVIASNVKLGEAIKTTTKTMTNMNKLQDPMKTAEMLKEFEKQNMRMDMTDEMINETLDGVLEGSDDEEQSDAIVNQILDEIGIEINSDLARAPMANKNAIKTSKATPITDADIDRMLAELK